MAGLRDKGNFERGVWRARFAIAELVRVGMLVWKISSVVVSKTKSLAGMFGVVMCVSFVLVVFPL